MITGVRAAHWLLWSQLVLAVTALAVFAASFLVGPDDNAAADVSIDVQTSIVPVCFCLLMSGTLGLVALQTGSIRRLAGTALLLIPVAVTLSKLWTTLLTAPTDGEAIDTASVEEEVEVPAWIPVARGSMNDVLFMLNAAHWLASAAILLAAVCGVLVLRVRPRGGASG
ncbi:hypothetical protein [Actinomadura sp. 6N118]|uniref:hypothetical protein n=1 Tax=Actinomadura sp. 6N118 TaxID=3375151 RepID=UPI0037BD476B